MKTWTVTGLWEKMCAKKSENDKESLPEINLQNLFERIGKYS